MDHHPCTTLLGSTILNLESKLALTEKDKEFSDELRKDCEVSGDG